MTVECQACQANTDAYLCQRCARQLDEALVALTRDLRDLRGVETRQAAGPLGLGDPRRQWDSAPADGSLPVTPWPYSPAAADQLWVIANTVTTWARHIAETRRVTPPDQAVTVRRFRATAAGVITVTARTHDPIETAAAWLRLHLDSIRMDQLAGQIHEEFTGLAAENELWIVGGAGVVEFYGTCDRPDVRVEPVTWTGPRCTGMADCDHDSCTLARNLEPMLRARAADCGASLYADPDAKAVDCGACGATYSTAERKRTIRGKLPDTLGTIAEIVGALTQLDAKIEVEALNSALRRGLITERGRNAKGHRLVRVRDVEEYLERVAKRRRTAVA